MAILTVRTVPDPVLRQKSKPVQVFNASLRKLVEDMVETMFSSDGVGIAAPQVGVLERVIIACETGKPGDEQVFVNPVISARSGEEAGTEGCLSVPGVSGDVKRAASVTLKAQNLEGGHVRLKANGFFARILQHEIDHLDGILFIDRVESPQKAETANPL
ncbi:MAG: peptide deformylase [Candidatus Omnitrophica bacterium]|nr:peptide deformylase [Candidatus Omnitrophota bacterium]